MNIFNDTKYKEYLANKTKEAQRDRTNLGYSAQEYNKKYDTEIETGTEKKRLLLEEGKRKGLKPEEICTAVFIPTRETPILNFLYFMLRDDPQGSQSLLEVLREDKDLGKDVRILEEQYNKETGHLQHNEYESKQPNMGMYLYGDVTLEMFDKIKKLKALSKSPNTQEAFSAYTKCNELCKKHGLEFDKIRCDV